MFFPESNVKIWLYAMPTDMRKSYDGLIALAKNQLAEDPLSGHLFVFFNRRRNRVKVLYFDRSGYCIWMKRLESGQFHFNAKQGEKQGLNWTQLKLILEGIQLENITTKRRYRHASIG
jgi:transposase